MMLFRFQSKNIRIKIFESIAILDGVVDRILTMEFNANELFFIYILFLYYISSSFFCATKLTML
jgi:hypothetical protein